MRTLLRHLGSPISARLSHVRDQDPPDSQPGRLRDDRQSLSRLHPRSKAAKNRGRYDRTIRLTAILTFILLTSALFAGGDGELELETDDQPQELLAIGGAHDIWPFSFGLNARFEDVEAALGLPSSITEEPAQGNGPAVSRWNYPGLIVTFLQNPGSDAVQILTVRFTDQEYLLRGGLEVGMGLDEAPRLMGEPRVQDGRSHVWFYSTTTIELEVNEGIVTAVQVARALP